MNVFKRNKPARLPSNVFSLAHDKKLSFDAGKLIPIFVAETIPGDYFKNRTEIFLRFAPMLFPVMHRVNVFTHFFYVPNRIVMPDFEKFLAQEQDAKIPLINIGAIAHLTNEELAQNGSLADYLGCPTMTKNPENFLQQQINALPFLAYQKIYNEYYRDEELQEPVDLDYKKFAGNYQNKWKEILTLRTRAWEKDYFTKGLTNPQKGAAVRIPVPTASGKLQVYLDPQYKNSGTLKRQKLVPIASPDNFGVPYGFHEKQFVSSYGNYGFSNIPEGELTSPQSHGPGAQAEEKPFMIDPNGTLFVDLPAGQQGPGGLIEDLRTAYQVQKFLERLNRSGQRYNEIHELFFGVHIPDERIQRPEYIGGGRSPVVISEVLQTSETREQEPNTSGHSTPQGTMTGHGISASGNNSFGYKCLEFGYIIGIMSVMPRSAYQQGMPRHFMKKDVYDYFWQQFSHLGEQSVYNGEIYWDYSGNLVGANKNWDAFCYQPKYSEYRFIPSTVHGDMRDSLKDFHWGRVFDSLPKLNEEFIKCDPGKRIFAVNDGTHSLWAHIYNDCKAVRPIPKYAEPGLSDHF